MNTLHLVCQNCNQVFNLTWCFNNKATIYCSCCKSCSDKFKLITPEAKDDFIITDSDFLPYAGQYFDAFRYIGKGIFDDYKMKRSQITLPIFLLNRVMDQPNHNDGLVTIEDVEKFINYIKL